MERKLGDADEMMDRQFKFAVSENREILRSIIGYHYLSEKTKLGFKEA